MEEKIQLYDGKENAIVIAKGSKAYRSSGGQVCQVLDQLDLNVEKGRIYTILGPSGCGKTTLLKCMLGKLPLDSGEVRVFGKQPGERSSGVPGSRVGYMPQELALFGEFNIAETLLYFSRIYGMKSKQYEERLEFLMKFLDLPSKTRKLEKMSGGQQRRASLAVALLHRPELLILDEPTVGVDPLLRQSIWNHLVDLSDPRGQATTVVITTHYTEEAIQAHRVGMMRNGRLLAEDAPAFLLSKFQKISLEEVFLHLCVHDSATDEVGDKLNREENHESEDSPQAEDNLMDKVATEVNEVISSCDHEADEKEKSKSTRMTSFFSKSVPDFNLMNVRACMLKTFNRMSKRWGFLIYQFVLPALQVALFCLAIGQDPKNLPISFVSDELWPQSSCDINAVSMTECPIDFNYWNGSISPNEHLGNLSCRYFKFLEDPRIDPIWQPYREAAIESVRKGSSWGVVYMDSNFTTSLYSRLFASMGTSGLNLPSPEVIRSSSIRIKLDVTNQQIAFNLQLILVEAFQKFLEDLVSSCHLPKDLASVPIEFEEPIFGTNSLTFTDFMAPGIILTIVHSMALGFSAMIIIIERNEGLLDRTWVAGVSAGEFSLAHFLCAISINIVQVVVTLTFMIAVFQVPVEGHLGLVFLITLLQGMCGITIGLIISSVCKTQQDATQIALGIFYPNMLLSGILWPLEAMPTALRYIAYCLPQTFACEALRAILLRGWDLNDLQVLRGFLVTIAWTVVTYLIFKIRMSRSS